MDEYDLELEIFKHAGVKHSNNIFDSEWREVDEHIKECSHCQKLSKQIGLMEHIEQTDDNEPEPEHRSKAIMHEKTKLTQIEVEDMLKEWMRVHVDRPEYDVMSNFVQIIITLREPGREA